MAAVPARVVEAAQRAVVAAHDGHRLPGHPDGEEVAAALELRQRAGVLPGPMEDRRDFAPEVGGIGIGPGRQRARQPRVGIDLQRRAGFVFRHAPPAFASSVASHSSSDPSFTPSNRNVDR